ncbi:MAG: NarL family transcriptional regulator, partial [Chitinophagaceae bacterium]|nr:NarL family transcriptional regulator [Chitinophagaceae bacterium]
PTPPGFTGNITRQPGSQHLTYKTANAGDPESDKVLRGGMLLACHHGLDDAQIAHVMDSISLFMKENLS